MVQRNLDYRLLKDRRNEYGISQNKLATACGLSRPYLNQIENGGVTALQNHEKILTNWKVLIPIYLYRYCLTM